MAKVGRVAATGEDGGRKRDGDVARRGCVVDNDRPCKVVVDTENR